MHASGTERRVRINLVNMSLLLIVVLLAGVWIGLMLGRPDAEEPVFAVERENAVPPQFRSVAVPVESAGASLSNARALSKGAWDSAPVTPALNMRETATTYDISVSLSGVQPKDLHIRTERSLLIIQAELKHPSSTARATTEGRLRIPPDAQLDALSAAFSNGYLHITIPRRVVAQ